jgi:hypothetical protein
MEERREKAEPVSLQSNSRESGEVHKGMFPPGNASERGINKPEEIS